MGHSRNTQELRKERDLEARIGTFEKLIRQRAARTNASISLGVPKYIHITQREQMHRRLAELKNTSPTSGAERAGGCWPIATPWVFLICRSIRALKGREVPSPFQGGKYCQGRDSRALPRAGHLRAVGAPLPPSPMRISEKSGRHP
jgi:hypothetical protein